MEPRSHLSAEELDSHDATASTEAAFQPTIKRATVTGDPSSTSTCELLPFGLTPEYLAMAEGELKPSWPGPVSFDDDDPEKGFAFISLKVPDVAEKKGFRGQLKPKEGTIIQPCFKEREINVKISTTVNGEQKVYEYKKNAHEDIVPEQCKIKYRQNYVILKLAKKVKDKPWAVKSSYYVDRP